LFLPGELALQKENGEFLSPYKKLIIYYFSGTGNSKNVAVWLSRVAEENDIKCEIINIASIDRINIAPPDPSALIAFISPIHGFNYPPVMLHFLTRFPNGKNNVLLMNTRAGMLIGKWITPGLTGVAFYLAALLLKLKGYSMKGMFPVDMPSNWISLHPGLNERTVKFLHVRNEERVTAFAKKVLSGGSNFKGLRDIVQDLLIAPASLGYYLVGRFFLAKTFYASKDCDDCGACIKGCPVKAIEKIDAHPFWTYRCESCMKCMSSCPKKAIETGHGFIIVTCLIFSILLENLVYKFIDPLPPFLQNGFITFTLESILLIGFFGVSYRILHYLLRFRIFERLVVYTSLTIFKFWGRRYRAIKNFRG